MHELSENGLNYNWKSSNIELYMSIPISDEMIQNVPFCMENNTKEERLWAK